MKKNILFFLLYTIMCFTSYSQNKQISYSSVNGLVTYDNGSGTKADIGAKLYIIPCKYFKQDIELKNDSIQMGYESLLQYIKWKELVGQEQAIAKLKEYDFYISAEEQITAISFFGKRIITGSIFPYLLRSLQSAWQGTLCVHQSGPLPEAAIFSSIWAGL